jgi:hypothetical protein
MGNVIGITKQSYQLNENSLEFSFFRDPHFLLSFQKMVLLVAPFFLGGG